MPLPTDEEAEDYALRLALEADENGEPLEEVEEVENEEDNDDVPPVTQAANVCKICLDGEARVGTLPCRHVAMCVACSEMLLDQRCPICRTIIQSMTTYFFS